AEPSQKPSDPANSTPPGPPSVPPASAAPAGSPALSTPPPTPAAAAPAKPSAPPAAGPPKPPPPKNPGFITCTIDGQEVVAKPGTNMIEAARLAGADIPYYCYHPRLTIAAN